MSATLITGGLVLEEDGPAVADVLVVDGVVADVAPDLAAHGAEVLDASGCWVGPGFVDLHTHLREPGGEYKEDIASGTAAAAAGGYTAVVAMPNTDPAVDAGHLARFVAERGAAAGYVDVMPAGCLSAGRRGTALAHLDELWEAGVRLFTDDGDSVEDAGLLRRAMEYLQQLGGVVVQHAIDRGLAAGGHMHEGTVSSRLGMQGVPALAEEIVVARDLALVRLTGARYHIQHVSTAGTVALVAEAKAAGLPVTAEVTPHHLAFCHDDVATTDPVFKMMPPLRTAEDRRVLRAALEEGVIDVVATDHAPHAPHEKDVPFEEAPNGVIGLEWAAAVVSSVCNLDAETFFTRMSITPAAIAGLADHGRRIGPGRVANLVVFDPAGEWVATTTVSRSGNAPYLGRPWRGSVAATMLRGRITSAPVGIRR
ncbi:MAG TPA: dihydroorotase [Acidimicrobiia bacterium]|jgi:dihydroorotase